MNEKELKIEKEHLTEVIDKVNKAYLEKERSLNVIGKGNLDRLKDIRESGETGADFEYLIYQLGEKNQIDLKEKFNHLQELKYLVDEPYFARIDLKDQEGDINQYYIGKFGYTERTPVVIDWRAKVASVFYRYRYPQKEVFYDTPKGKVVRDLVKKRTYDIENGSLYKFYDNDIQFDEASVISSKISKRTGGVLQDIIETIQLSQIEVIEADPRQVCIVQGCVGSGKSTVAIHKLAHIFYNFPHIIHPKRSILIAKNQILVGYLSTLFPKLGIFDINFKTLRDLVYNIVFREGFGIKVDFDKHDSLKEWDIKKINALNIGIEKVHDLVENEIERIYKQSNYVTFKGYKYSRMSTPLENIVDITSDLEEELLGEKEFLKNNPNHPRTLLYKDNIKAIRALLSKLNLIAGQIKEKHFNEIMRKLDINTKEVMSYKQTLLYTYVFTELVGFSKVNLYEFCAVDEGQDFCLLEYLVLNKFVVRGRFAIFGDLNQNIEEGGIEKWEDISKIIKDAKSANTFELTTNYRSTKQIIKLACEILKPYSQKYLPKSIERVGSEPVVKYFDNQLSLLEEFTAGIKEDEKTLNKSVGVIVTNADLYPQVQAVLYKNLKENNIIELSDSKKIRYVPVGIYLMNDVNCKGLEFSKVYVLGSNLNKVKNAAEARKAFVSVTRAMNELVVLGVK